MLFGVTAALVAGAISVAAPAACPGAAAIAAQLDHLGAGTALAQVGTAEVSVEGTRMRIVMSDRQGRISTSTVVS